LSIDLQHREAQSANLGTYLQTQLSTALTERGFLVVERTELALALNELSVAGLSDRKDAPRAGELLDAQALVVGNVTTAGDRFLVTAEVISTRDGSVLGAASAPLPRENALLLSNAAIETKSALGAAFRSAVAPGWGQYYNDEPVKAVGLGGMTYSFFVASALSAIGTVGALVYYVNYVPDPGTAAADQKSEVLFRRNLTNVMLWVTCATFALTMLSGGFTIADALLVGGNTYE